MARFSVWGEADEGSSVPRRKRQRIPNPFQQSQPQQEENEAQEDEEESLEEVEGDSSDEEPEKEDEEEEAVDSVNNQIATVEPRSSNAPASAGPSRNGGICVTLTDPEVLDCPICYESFTIPVFQEKHSWVLRFEGLRCGTHDLHQCENGHTACSSCCKKVAHKCPSCSLPIGYNRCRAIEKILESVKLPCQNLKYGCKEMVSYSKKFDHDKICNHAPCSCPISSCHFVGSHRQLYQHVSSKHKGSALRFKYNVTSPVFFTSTDKSLLLQEEKEGVLFILNNKEDIHGNVIAINCIGPSSSRGGYFYELAAKTEGSNLRFQCFTKTIQKVDNDDFDSEEFLLVPNIFFGSYGQISLDVCIWRYGVYPAGILPRTSAKIQKN